MRSSVLRLILCAAAAALGAATAGQAEAQAPGQDERAAHALRVTGEVGTRAEFIANENFAERDATRADDARLRLRVRVRFGAEYRASEAVTAALRLSTGDNAFPSSAWTSLSNDLRRHPIQIDRAYIEGRLGHVQLRLGMGPNPLFTPTELLWDADIQTAGVAEIVPVRGSGLQISAGQFMLRENRSLRPRNERSAWLLAEGLAYTRRVPGLNATLGVSHYQFTNPDAIARSLQVGELDGEFKTNRFDPGGRTIPNPADTTRRIPVDYFSGFSVLDVGGRLELSRVPVTITAEIAINLGARRDTALGAAYRRRQGLAFGANLRYRGGSGARTWTLGVGYFHIASDAVLAVYNSDDLQQTNVNTVPVELTAQLPGGMRVVWDTYLQKKISTDLPSNGGITHPENALKVRTRLSALVGF